MWLGLGVFVSVVGAGLATATSDWAPTFIVGLVIAGCGGVLTSVCIVGIGVSVGMLRYNHLRTKR